MNEVGELAFDSFIIKHVSRSALDIQTNVNFRPNMENQVTYYNFFCICLRNSTIVTIYPVTAGVHESRIYEGTISQPCLSYREKKYSQCPLLSVPK